MPSPALTRRLRRAGDEKEEEQEDQGNDDDEEDSPISSSSTPDMQALKNLTRFVQMGCGQIGSSESRLHTNSFETSAAQTQLSSFTLPTLLQQASKTPSAAHLFLKHAFSPAHVSIQASGLPAEHSHFLPLELAPELPDQVPNRVAASVFEDIDPEDDESMTPTHRSSTLSSTVADPYANALVLHREKIESARIDLEAEYVDSLAARLSTQRQDALAELKASREIVPILQEDLDEIRVIWGGSLFIATERGASIRCNPAAGMCLTEQEESCSADLTGAASWRFSSSLSTGRSVLQKSVIQDPFLTGNIFAEVRQHHSASTV